MMSLGCASSICTTTQIRWCSELYTINSGLDDSAVRSPIVNPLCYFKFRIVCVYHNTLHDITPVLYLCNSVPSNYIHGFVIFCVFAWEPSLYCIGSFYSLFYIFSVVCVFFYSVIIIIPHCSIIVSIVYNCRVAVVDATANSARSLSMRIYTVYTVYTCICVAKSWAYFKPLANFC